jgi:hypothetical protein
MYAMHESRMEAAAAVVGNFLNQKFMKGKN